ncbi:hypothetical protein B0H34DRAFT_673223 [Crassisporium funariophilum]|nr:hypothetical protein B0H34DRAFT_673223 [Crassisporium funariophilum]
MNFLDTYDITRSATPNPNQPEQPTLNEEVNQVIGQLGRFWGGFRKQSQTALESARKDFGEVVVQAQKELSKLTTTEESKESEVADATDGAAPELSESTSTTLEDSSTSLPTIPDEPVASSSSQSLFSRLQSALPPNIVATVQNNLPESLKHASENIDFTQVRTNLLSEFQRVQGVTLAQAEEYVHKSETLLREAVKEAGEVLRDAVKVLPPDEAGSSGGGSGMIWDGTDMWMLPTDSSEMSGSTRHGKEASSSSRSGDMQSALATRAEALLRRLKHDPSILRHDPAAEEHVKDEYNLWREGEVDTIEGGIDGMEWKVKIAAMLEEPIDGQALKELQDTLAPRGVAEVLTMILVPSELTKSDFWLRFFFRTHQIRKEEEKRKALILSSTSNDEEFSWEDDDEETSATNSKTITADDVSSQLTVKALKETQSQSSPSSRLNTGTPSTPRVSSEDSFDLVSSSNSAAGDEKPPKAKSKDEDDGGDSDWE